MNVCETCKYFSNVEYEGWAQICVHSQSPNFAERVDTPSSTFCEHWEEDDET